MADELKKVGFVWKNDGHIDFVKTLREVSLEMNKNYNEFKLAQSQWDESTSKIQKLREQYEYLTNACEIQEDKVNTLKMQLGELESAENKNISAIKKKRTELLNAEVQLNNYNNRLKNTKTDLSNAEKGIKTTADKLQELTQRAQENESKFKLLQAQYTSMTSTTQKLKDEKAYLSNAYDIENEKIKLLKEQLKELENSEDKNEVAISKKRVQITQTETELQKYKKRLDEVTNKINTNSEAIKELGKNIEEKGKKMEEAGKKLSASSVATLGALTASAKGAIEFESAFTGVEKTVDATDEQLEELKTQIRQMAKEIPSTTTEIAGVAEAAGQLGIKTENIMDFTRVMIDLGNSTNLSADEAATALAKFANVTNMSADNYSNLGSTIVALGNNFATTEADIVSMATRLAGAGHQIGLTEDEIMAFSTALSSAGIEAEMGGSAFSKAMIKMQVACEGGTKQIKSLEKATGKSMRELELLSENNSKAFGAIADSVGMTKSEIKKLITSGKQLENFAEIAGMTAEEFEKAYKEDASEALRLFIKGLGNTEEAGESTIKMLEDMGFTEVRLRDSLTRLANSSDLVNNAIDLANESWKENNALSNEANKRYETLQSKMTVTLNKIKDIGITLGNKLMPSIEKVIDKIGKWTEKFDQLDEKQIDTIVKIGLVIAAIGPLLTIFGKVTSTIGGAVSTFGNFVEAIGVMKGNITTASTSVTGLANTLSAITSPVGVAIGATAALTAAVVAINKEINKDINQEKERTEEIIKQKGALEELKNQQQENLNANLSEIENTKRLKDELSKLVDENGNVKETYKGRVQFILNELNDALGTEYKMTENVIENYKELTDSIDEAIEKKKASIILSTQEEAYTNAVKNQAEAAKKLGEIQADLNEKLRQRNELEKQLKTASEDGGNYSQAQKIRNQITALNDLIGATQTSYDEQKSILQTYYQDIATYETNAALVQQGTAEAIKQVNDSVLYSYQNRKEQTIQALNETLNSEIVALNTYKDTYANNQSEVTQTQMQESQKRLDCLVQELIDSTSTVNENSPEVIKAWSDLATGQYDTYFQKVAPLDETLRKKIEEMTGVIIEKKPELVNETQNMAQKILEQIEKEPEFKQEALNNLQGMLNGMEDEQLRSFLETAGTTDVDRVMKGIREGNLAEDEGLNILKNLKNGLNSSKWQNSLFSVARGIASTLSGLLTVKANVNGKLSKLPGHKSGLDYVPKDNYVARLHKGERVLTKEENEDYTEAEKRNKKHTYISKTKNKEESIQMKDIDYEKLFKIFLKALNSCKMKFDRDGYVGFIDDRLLEVM